MEQGVRYSIPTRLDAGEYGQVTKVIGDNEAYVLYIQTSHDEPSWLPMSTFLEKVFHYQLSDPLFIRECLELYHGKSDRQESLQVLGNILKRY